MTGSGRSSPRSSAATRGAAPWIAAPARRRTPSRACRCTNLLDTPKLLQSPTPEFTMFDRREFLARTLKGSSLIALATTAPRFILRTARAAEGGKDTVLVVLEMGGGNDGLNTVIPYADDLYHKARPTLRHAKDAVIRLDDHVGLHPRMTGLRPLWEKGRLAVVQGVGYPNRDRSHFDAMDIWQSADPNRLTTTGWIGRSAAEIDDRSGGVPILHVGPSRLPLALTGAPGGGAVSVNDQNSFRLEIGGGDANRQDA